MRYVVIESTPGYMPDDDDPFTTDDYAAAVAHLNELAAGYADDPDGNYEVTYGLASSANLAAVAVADLDKIHDLGRWIAIEIDEESNDAGADRVTLEILYESTGDHDAETNWEHNYYDPDSRRAEAIYRAVVEEVGKLRELLGDAFAAAVEGEPEQLARRLAGEPEETPGA
jgi:hypothetical protein